MKPMITSIFLVCYTFINAYANHTQPFLIPPINDNCEDATMISIPGNITGTTHEATSETDKMFSGCTANLNEADVWYKIPIDSAIIGVKITIDNWTGAGDFGVEAFKSIGNCELEIIEGAQGCGPHSKTFEIVTRCFDASMTSVYIKIGSASDINQVGEFTLSVEELIPDCSYADVCEDAIDTIMLNSSALGEITEKCTFGCLDFACPDVPPGVDCGFSEMPTVWYHLRTDDIARQLYTTVTTTGTWTPVWSVYQGTNCSNLTQVAGGNGMTAPCSNDDLTPTLHQTAVEITSMDYWVAITADPNGPPIDDPNFEFCAWTTINLLVCLGEDGNCEPDPSLIIEVLERENGDNLNGPFCPGEKVTVRLKFFYDATESGADWLIGLVPSFGNGWEFDEFDFQGNAPPGANWYDEDGPCAPLIQEHVPNLCVYEDANGRLRLCNKICEACAQYCGTNSGLMPGDALPSGWFWVTNGGNAGCTNDCSPSEGWGIGSTNSLIDFNMELTVKDFNDMTECLQNNNLQISFQTFSDGVAGCWEDPVGECIIDRKQFGPLWEIECEKAPAVIATPDPFEIYKMGLTDITVSTVDGSNNATIIIEVIDNPDVTGENNWEFSDGYGIVADNLFNLTGEVQTVTYHAHSEVDGIICPGGVTDFTAVVYPTVSTEEVNCPECPDLFCMQHTYLYPNPSTDKLFIKTGDCAIDHVAIYSMEGKLISKASYTNDGLDISHIPPGLYFVQLDMNGRKLSLKFVKI